MNCDRVVIDLETIAAGERCTEVVRIGALQDGLKQSSGIVRCPR